MQTPEHDALHRRIAELERELAEARKRADELEDLIEHMPQPVFEVDCLGGIIYANGRTFDLFGYDRGELADGLTVPQMIAPECREQVMESFRRVLMGEDAGGGEYLARRKDGSTFPVNIYSVPFDSGDRLRGMRGLIVDISARKRMEEALRESETRYRKLLELLPDAMYEFRLFRAGVTPEERERILALVGEIRGESPEEIEESARRVGGELLPYLDGEMLFLNEIAVRTLGYPAGHDGRITLRDIIPPGLLEETFFRAITIFAPGIHRDIVYRVADTGGNLLRVSVNSRLINREYPFTIEGVARDVNRQHEMENALRESERRYRLIFDTVPVSIWEYDYSELIPEVERLRALNIPDYRRYLEEHPECLLNIIERIHVMDVNPETLRLYGAASKGDLNGSYRTRHTPEAVRTYRDAMIAFMEGESHFSCETVNETVDGRRLEVFVQLTFPSDPEFSGRVLQTAIDITARKEAERALRESELKYRSIVEHTAEGITVVNETGDIIEWNEGAETLTGIPRPEAVGRKIWDVRRQMFVDEFSSPGRMERLRELLEEALRSGKGPFLGTTMDLTFRRADGETRFMQQIVSAIPTGRGYMLVYTNRDITEHKRLEEERLKADKLESIGLLAGGIAHDFNNILVSILGNISLARLCRKDRERGDILSDAEAAAYRARDLTNQLLTFSKGGAPVKETASMAEIIRESAGFCLRGSNVRCEFTLPADLRPVEVDRGQMNRVVNNLILNAVQAMPGGGTITVGGSNLDLGAGGALPLPPGRYVEVFVRDQGVGVSPENLSRLFDPYFTTKETGTGLGLATTWSIIRNHGGHVRVDSEEGRGAVFTLYLPATDARPEPGTAATAPAGSSTGRILVMDDDPEVREVLTRMLQYLGHEADACRDGREALARYREARESGRPFDAVIMDLTIPGGMGGKEAVGELLKYDPGGRVIVSSGYSSERIASDYREHGFRAVLAKPYRMEELREVVLRVLNPDKRRSPHKGIAS